METSKFDWFDFVRAALAVSVLVPLSWGLGNHLSELWFGEGFVIRVVKETTNNWNLSKPLIVVNEDCEERSGGNEEDDQNEKTKNVERGLAGFEGA